MFKFIERYKARKEAERLAEIKKHKDDERATKKLVEQVAERMTEKPCPINKGKMCYMECAHFSKGSAYYLPSYTCGIPGWWGADWPKCKLWKNC